MHFDTISVIYTGYTPRIPVLVPEPKNVVVTKLGDIPSPMECQLVEAFEIALKTKFRFRMAKTLSIGPDLFLQKVKKFKHKGRVLA